MNNFKQSLLMQAVETYGTPLWLYDGAVIRDQIKKLRRFDVIRYAQKAASNIHILRLMRQEGLLVDAVSAGELQRSLTAGFTAGDIVYTADLIDSETLLKVLKQGVAINVGSIDMLERIGASAPAGYPIWLRVNPGFGHGHSNKTNTGGDHSKHGLWLSDLPQAIKMVRHYNLRLVGLHMHIGSGADYLHLSKVCGAMVQLVKDLGCDINAISAGGGLSIPYRDSETEIDPDHYFNLWNEARIDIESHLGHRISLEIEPGRFLTAQSGLLISKVHVLKATPSHNFVLVDAGFNDLLRPALYGSHREIMLLPGDGSSLELRKTVEVVIAGPLCEAGDVFTVDADGIIGSVKLHKPKVGDLLIFRDTGAYGSVMSSNYNSRPLSPEVLIEEGNVRLIRRRQTIEDLLELERC